MTEFDDLFRFADIFNIRTYLEIGALHGHSLRNAYKWLGFERAVVVDLPNAGSGGAANSIIALKKACEDIRECGTDVQLIIGDSHDPEVISKIRAMPKFDLVLIDGDHSAAGCNQDWANYGDRGRLVAFHDIQSFRKWPYVGGLWMSLSSQYAHATFQRGELNVGGVGCIIHDTANQDSCRERSKAR